MYVFPLTCFTRVRESPVEIGGVLPLKMVPPNQDDDSPCLSLPTVTLFSFSSPAMFPFISFYQNTLLTSLY